MKGAVVQSDIVSNSTPPDLAEETPGGQVLQRITPKLRNRRPNRHLWRRRYPARRL